MIPAVKTPEERVQELLAQHEKRDSHRKTLETQWQEIADYFLPNQNNITRTYYSGQKRNLQIFDSTAVQSNELLAGALHGMLTNPASIWFEYTSGDMELDHKDIVRDWLHDCTLKTHSVMNGSNFQTEVHEFYLEQGSFGTAALFTEEDPYSIVRFHADPIATVFIEENNLGVIDRVDRKWKWNLRQIIQEFGEQSLPQKLLDEKDKHMEKEFTVLQCIYPRENAGMDDKVGPKNWKYASDTILVEEKCFLRESGYREFPGAIARWTKQSGDIYGYSPAAKCLPEVKMLNEMMKTVLRGAQKTVDPPLMLPDDGFVLPLRTTPGGINYRRSGNSEDKIEAFGNDARIDFGYQVLEDVRKRIREAFYVDQLQLAQGPQMTATEVLQRTEEKLKLMGPMLGRQQSEFLRPMITRVHAIMQRCGMFAPPPAILKQQTGGIMGVKYSSAIAKAQRATEGNNLQRWLQAVSALVQTNPECIDNIDTDEFVRTSHAIFGASPAVLRDQDKIDEIRKQRNAEKDQAKQQVQQQGVAQALGQVLPGMAKAKEAGLP